MSNHLYDVNADKVLTPDEVGPEPSEKQLEPIRDITVFIDEHPDTEGIEKLATVDSINPIKAVPEPSVRIPEIPNIKSVAVILVGIAIAAFAFFILYLRGRHHGEEES